MAASVFSQVVINGPQPGQVMATATQVVEAGGPSVLVFNSSTSTTVYLSQDNYVTSLDAQLPVISPLGPQQSIVFDGTLNVYAVAVAGAPATLFLYPSAVNFTPSTTVTNLFSGGTPSAGSAFTVAAGATTTVLNMVDVSLFNSYDLTFGAFLQNQGLGENAFTARITFTWYDAPGVVVFSETFEPWVGNNVLANLGGYPNTWGSGKMHGRFLSVTIFNYSGNAPATLTVQYLSIFGSPRTVDDTLWRQDASTGLAVNPGAGGFSWVSAYQTAAGAIVPGAPAGGSENILAQLDNITPGANSKNFWPFSMFNGPVTIRYNQSGTWGNGAAICSAAGAISGNILPGAQNSGIVVLFANTTGIEQQAVINAPHAPLFLVTNAGATSPTFSLIAIAKEGQ